MLHQLLILSSLGCLTVTSYQSIPTQTDSTPFHTSVNWHTNPAVAAISQDMLKSGEVAYGDVIYIPGYGMRIVSDVMNERHNRSIDLWVENKTQEQNVGKQKLEVFIFRAPERATNRGDAMAMVNAKKIRKWINDFKKEHGREPRIDEFQRHFYRGK